MVVVVAVINLDVGVINLDVGVVNFDGDVTGGAIGGCMLVDGICD
jgi:hypothetical protein